MNDCKELIPGYLRFVKGVVDSADLSLNVSREILQNNPLVRRIGKNVVSKVLGTLKEMQENETEAYEAEALGELEELGATIIELDDLSEWQDAVRPLWSKYGADYQDLLDDIAALQ